MSPEQRAAVVAALARFGARLTEDNVIACGERSLHVRVAVTRGRLRMMHSNGGALASYPATRIAESVDTFCRRFWYWKPLPAWLITFEGPALEAVDTRAGEPSGVRHTAAVYADSESRARDAAERIAHDAHEGWEIVDVEAVEQ